MTSHRHHLERVCHLSAHQKKARSPTSAVLPVIRTARRHLTLMFQRHLPVSVSTDVEEEIPTPILTPTTINSRRNLLPDHLSNHKQERLKRKLPVDSQLLAVAKEDIALKKKCLEQSEQSQKALSDSLSAMSANMQTLTSTISQGFNLLGRLLIPDTSLLPPPSHHVPMSCHVTGHYQTGTQGFHDPASVFSRAPSPSFQSTQQSSSPVPASPSAYDVRSPRRQSAGEWPSYDSSQMND